ncbi:tyrosine-type recombinase/integrase [Fluoribacter dumoffii]|uniref:tyrosine-type recombinase/integrase n=1 Tax=Fluoribacter dumoffii TaxID=463 RepID=UPI00026C7705|nr:site-specific integrase [Fluoribacter dumoffii]
MALYKRDGVWWTDIFHKGKRVRKSTGTTIRQDAQRFHDQLKNELWNEKVVNSIPNKSWMDAVVRWLEESAHKRSLETDKIHLSWLDPYLKRYLLADIDSNLIESIAKKKERTGVTLSTVNRVLEILRAILTRAHKEWGWLESMPLIRMRRVENRRIRWLSKEEVARLLKELPTHLKDMAAFTLATGLRESNVTQLKWAQINLERGHALIHPEDSKTNRAIPVPLNKQAISIISSQEGKHPIYVFTYQGKPVTRCNNHAWQKALARAGIEDFRWHDLRHTWASWHVQNGTALHELQQLGGWSNYEMVLRYAHLSSEHLKVAAERIHDTFMPQ